MVPLVLLVPLLVAPLSGDGGGDGLGSLLAAAGDCEEVSLADLSSRRRLEGLDLLVWDTRSRALPAAATDPATMETVREWVAGGGKLLLFSHAVRWMHELGFETVAPDRDDTRLLGSTDAHAAGAYLYGIRAKDPTHPLFRGLEPFADHDDVFFLTGGHAVRNESCFWERRAPARAEVLGTFFRRAYGEERGFAHRSLVTLAVGQGRVLALGCGPLARTGNPYRANLARFVANAVAWLRGEGGGRSRIGVLPCLPAQLGVDTTSSAPPAPTPAPWPEEFVGPRLPYIAHWGWHGQIDYQRGGRRSADLAYFRAKIIDESAAWGANLLEFYPPDMEKGFPWAWAADDPLPPPESYWGGGFDPLWDAERTRAVTAHAHSRGFLVHSFHHPNPVRGSMDDFVTFTAWAARQFMNPLLHGRERAWDGFGWEWFPSDREGRLTAALWSYAPGAYEYSTSVLPSYTPNFSGTLMCAFGRLGSLNACGYSDQWRHVYHAPLYVSYQADCRTRKPSEEVWGGWGRYGGGSYPDWILRQVNDFCRERLQEDSAIWWLGEPASTLHAKYRDYVYGITSDPIRCAVACKLWATGRGGYRETMATLSSDPPPGYASGPALPLQTAILQNNYLRFVRYHDRDGGRLLFDPLHLGRFDPDVTGAARAVVLLDDLGGAGTGKTAPVLDERVRLPALGGGFPARLAYETPGVRSRLVLPFEARVGLHRLLLEVAKDAERGFVEVRLDGEPIGFYATGVTDEEERPPPVFEFGVVTPGRHELVLDVQSGGAHTLAGAELRRISPRAVHHSITAKAGGLAALREVVADVSTGVLERVERVYRMASDDPVLTIECSGVPPLPASAVAKARDGWLRRDEAAAVWVAARMQAPSPEANGDGEGRCRWTVGVAPTRERAEEFLHRDRSPTGPSADRLAVLPDSTEPAICFVREDDAAGRAWWTQRGSQRHGSTRLLRFRGFRDTAAGGRTRIRIEPFLPNGFRPGWGCQHALAFEDVGESRGTCRVRVAKTGPFLFAPRIEFADGVRGARVDGKDWRYLDARHVFLPSIRGDYDVSVVADGPELPSLLQTRLTVTACRWDAEEQALRVTTEPPSWYTGPLPGGIAYTMLVDPAGRDLAAVEGGEVIPLVDYPLRTVADRETMGAAGIVLRVTAPTTVLRFRR